MNTNKKIVTLLIVIILVMLGYFFIQKEHTAVPVVITATSTEPVGEAATSTTIVTHPVTPTSTPVTVPVTSTNMVTPADNGTTIMLTKGQRFGVAMGDTLEWTLSFDPSGIVTRVPNIATLRGEQGVYTATAIGTTTLHAIGAPICNPGEACPQFRQAVTVILVVK
jgi:hypothetical protein